MGEGDVTKVKIEKVQETLTDAITKTAGISDKERVKAVTVAWFKE